MNYDCKSEVEKLDEYHILNLDESGRFWIDYEIPSGYVASKPFDDFEQANNHIKYLNELNRDPSYMVSILGYFIFKEHYIQVFHKKTFLY